MRTSSPSWLRIGLGRSHRLAATLMGAHLLAAAGLIASRLPGVMCAAVLVMLALSLALTLRRYAWLVSARSLVLLDLSDTLDIEAEDRSGRRIAGSVLGTTFVAPWLVVINFKAEGRRLPHTVVILPDAVDQDSCRALRVWLRWRRAPMRDG